MVTIYGRVGNRKISKIMSIIWACYTTFSYIKTFPPGLACSPWREHSAALKNVLWSQWDTKKPKMWPTFLDILAQSLLRPLGTTEHFFLSSETNQVGAPYKKLYSVFCIEHYLYIYTFLKGRMTIITCPAPYLHQTMLLSPTFGPQNAVLMRCTEIGAAMLFKGTVRVSIPRPV